MTLTATGAFGKDSDRALVDMSPHKWRVLLTAAKALHILPYVTEGVELLSGDELLPEMIKESLSGKKEETVAYDYSNAKLYNFMTSRRWDGVVNEETSSDNISETTLIMLDIIISIMDDMVCRDVNILGLITLGQYIRRNKDSIDYEKLLRWLAHIGLVQVARLEGSMLISCFGFKQSELPFVDKLYDGAERHVLHCINHPFTSHSFSSATKFNVAMLETISYNFMRAITTVTDVEE